MAPKLNPLTFTSCQAPIADEFCRDVVAWLATQLAHPTRFLTDIPWQERERLFDAGQIDVAWICGAPYVQKVAQPDTNLELLVAPVMAHPRYEDKPVYFSDVVVHRDSPYARWEDLRGRDWVYNEPHSHSGYHVVCYALAQRGQNRHFFGRVWASGSHQKSLRLILNRQVHASAIDSTVLEMVCAQDPAIGSQIRVIDTLGPSPMPPWCIGRHVPPELRRQVRQLLLRLPEDESGQTLLARHRFNRFAAVTDQTYDAIRQMLSIGAGAQLPHHDVA